LRHFFPEGHGFLLSHLTQVRVFRLQTGVVPEQTGQPSTQEPELLHTFPPEQSLLVEQGPHSPVAVLQTGLESLQSVDDWHSTQPTGAATLHFRGESQG